MLDDDQRHPVGGVDYPRTLQEFDEWFSPRKRRAPHISGVCGGLAASDAQGVKGRLPVPRPEVSSNA